MQSTHGQFHPTRFEDLAVTVDFHCNSACVFCIVQEGMNRYKGVPLERFAAMVEENKRSGKYQRVIFTGGEVTLEKGLAAYVRLARDAGVFRYLRVQTNGRRLADPAAVQALCEDGLNEFFVSVHGHDAASHDAITQRPGSFDELVACLHNLQQRGVRVLTNTVMTRRNRESLPGIVELAARYGVVRMEFWNYLPMEDQKDERDLIASVSELGPPLLASLDRCDALGLEAVVKYVPRCLLGAHGSKLDNSQPDVLIVEDFWSTFPLFNCAFEAHCEHSEECMGLQHAYVNKFGWELAVLAPAPRARPWSERAEPLQGKPEQYGERPAAPESAHPAWESLLQDVGGAVAKLEGVQLTRTQARYRFRGEGRSVEVVLSGRDEGSQALARTRSFNLFYAQAEGFDGPEGRAALSKLLEGAVQALRQRDEGKLQLDHRKGLLQVLPPARQKPRR